MTKKKVSVNEKHRAKVANHDDRFEAIWQAIQLLAILTENQAKAITAIETKLSKKGK